jgi:hypothetical protein
MYFVAVILLLLVLPIASIAASSIHSNPTVSLLFLTGKWFVFWGVGIRLLIAGLRQTIQPAFTAREIFGIHDTSAFPIVREIGFANISIGILGICTIFRPDWIIPAAIVGGLYYGLAGALHLPHKQKNAKENTAMISDFFIFLILLVFVVKTLS